MAGSDGLRIYEDLLETAWGRDYPRENVRGRSLGGGCINDVRLLSCRGREDLAELVIKSRSGAPEDFFPAEARGLKALGAAIQAAGITGLRTPRVLAVSSAAIIIEKIETSAVSSLPGFSARSFGRNLAEFHLRSAGQSYGATRDNYIGLTVQKNGGAETSAPGAASDRTGGHTGSGGDARAAGAGSSGRREGAASGSPGGDRPENTSQDSGRSGRPAGTAGNPAAQRSWPEFFAEFRLGYQLELAGKRGHADSALRRDMDRLISRLGSGNSDLIPEYPPASLLHGDLWGGNYMKDGEGRAVLIDPAVYRGHGEADVAMTELFGGFSSEFYRGYSEVIPLDRDYARRRELYNLYHLLNHLNLFGSGYYSSVAGALRAIGI